MEVILKFLNNQMKPEVVCNYLVDYDYDFDRVVVMNDIEGFFGISPFIYTHIGDC